ncbi:acyl-CoA dehydrogenase family protein [Pendulispora brunnea]|uniref:Acyl-CoA dehydrogenase family protein n=1 Tax=Pendulispora brunnea TaxID=2905690 RepID=A0ABZ2JVX6_9BACT
MNTPYFDAEHREVRARVRAALARVVLPNAEAWEASGHIPIEGWRALGREGLLGFGHAGSAFLESAILLEELGRTGYAGIRASVGVHAYMALSYLELFGTAEQRDAYLPGARRGERILALAITEAHAGSDLRHLQTRAEPVDDGYRVSGEKHYVTNGSQADVFVTVVRSGDKPAGKGLTGASLLLIDAKSPGVTRSPMPLACYRSADVCQVTFDGVFVPANRLIGRKERALMHLMHALDFERLCAGLLAVGGVGHCLDLLDRFVREHQIKDAPLAANQAVRHRLSEHDADFELVRHYAYHAAWLHARGELDTRTASIVKLKATELAVTAAQTCLQYHGARGYLAGAAPARIYRDAMAGTIAAGASELMRDMIFETNGHQP